MKSTKTILVIILIVALIILGVFAIPKVWSKIENYFKRQKIEEINKETLEEVKRETTELAELSTTDTQASDENSANIDSTESIETPSKIAYLEVPFITQAPLETEANWTLHEESCEEAALLQAYLYETGQTITKEKANEVILDMIAWEEKLENFGDHRDLYADDMKKFIIGYYGLSEEDIKIIYDAEIEDIKREIASGHPVIVPITGDILNNPYYPYPGYHMLTVIGYNEDRIITNDNGTRRGAGFSYDTKIFEAAMKDAGGDVIIFYLKNT